MNKLEMLITELCPLEVKYTQLGSICKIETGKLNANAAVEDGQFMFFTTAKEVSRIDTYRWDTEALLVAGNANVGDVKHYIGKFEAYQRTYVLTKFSESVSVQFLYYVLSNNLKHYLESRKNEAAMTYIVLSTLAEFPIPLPPLPVQQEIVRILDSFTELTAELTARRKQYEYYKEKTFNIILKNSDVVYLSEVATFSQGIQVEPSKQYAEMADGRIRFLRIVDFVSDDEPIRYIEKSDDRYLKSEGELIMIRYGASAAGKVFTCHSGAIANNMFKINLVDGILPAFMKHYLSQNSIYTMLNSTNGKSTMPAVNFRTVGKIPVPMIPISKQQRIVDIFDRFDALCNDLSSGLPAEIAARQKQYEYYRDKLLTFKEIQS